MPGGRQGSTAPGRDAGARRVVLLTGMSGAGKSTALRALAERGHRTVDLDHGGYTRLLRDPATPIGWSQEWDLERVAALLDGHRGGGPAGERAAAPASRALFVAGTVVNQARLYDRFDAVVLLTAPADLLLARIAQRTDNPFGKDPLGRATVLHHVATLEPRLRAEASHVLDTRAPVPAVADALERIAMAAPTDEVAAAEPAGADALPQE
ncbi:AAA family ATPase [Puerhibacterium sp. TATVAM-FAB25]|uniref:AAA family ATPase n=1 Tax=Puerhibacterium sp. TATVAM-FAB25 TaxID=3093699 RepID=UPI0039786932